MKLLTRADLEGPEDVTPLVQEATQLIGLYSEFIERDAGGYEYIVDIGAEGDRAPGVHASEISNCFRQLVYSLSAVERKHAAREANMRMRFGMGHAVHAMLQSNFHRLTQFHAGWLEFQDEVKIHPGLGGSAELWDIHSSCDGVFTFYNTNGAYMRVGLEIKTASALEYEKLKEPHKGHKEQCCTYMACLDLPLMWVLYYNKSNSNITESKAPWLIKFDRALWEQDLEVRIATAQHYAEVQELPDREEGFYCGWCPWSWHCMPKKLKYKSKRGTKPRVSPAMIPRR